MQEQVVDDMRSGQAAPSWMKTFLDGRSKWGFNSDTEGAYAVGMHGIAGALTIAAPMQTFCLAMTHYPQFLPMLHEELDRVCGDRMPRSEDRPNLPFLRAIIRECIRWRPPVPTGIPHYLIQDDEYNGYHIPKGSTIHPLEWAISRDPDLYPDPEAFNPLRWIKPDSVMAEGHALDRLWLMKICLLASGAIAWLFDIKKSPAESAIPPVMKSTRTEYKIGMNEKASISNEELNAGLDTTDPTMEEKILAKFSYPGSDSANDVQEKSKAAELAYKPLEWGDITKKPEDPTLDYSILLIAKPIPFKFDLKPRDTVRMNTVRGLFNQGVENGDYPKTPELLGSKPGTGLTCGLG
ncbi:unnamed protein product [Alternaria alternata]